MLLAHLTAEEMPREKLLTKGAYSLSTVELIAVLMRTGVKGEDVLTFSASLLDRFGGLEGLCRASTSELMQEKGLKESKVATLAAVIELGKRIAVLKNAERSSWQQRAEAIALDTKFMDREQIFALFIDAKDRVIEEEIISYGGQSGAFMDIPVFYRKAVRLNASSLVLIHNHPDGTPYASREDICLTDNIRSGLELLGVKLIGHFVAANGLLTQVP